MSFGPYADFNDCIAKNKSKASPEGYSAWLYHQITGGWPSASDFTAPMPTEPWDIYLKEYASCLTDGKGDKAAHETAMAKVATANWLQSPGGWSKQYSPAVMKNVQNIRIFGVGTWTDSIGFERAYTSEDIDNMAAAFNDGVPAMVALKAGHTPDSFNAEIAKEMGVPVQIVTGNLGKGQISLGRMVTMERRSDALFGAFDRVPEGIANLIESGQFNTVSVEIEDKIGNYGPVITGVAMLGAEEPAVDIATMDKALVFGGRREGARVLTFALKPDGIDKEFTTLKDKMSQTIKGMRGAPVFRVLMAQLQKLYEQMSTSKHSQEGEMEVIKFQLSPEEQGAITTALGIAPEATFAEVLGAIEALKTATPAEGEPGAAPEMAAKPAEPTAEFSKMSSRVKELEHKELVHTFSKSTNLLDFIEGKPEEMAETLATLSETAGDKAALSVLATYQTANDVAQKAAKAVGSAKPGARSADFEASVTEYSKAHPETARAECYKAVMTTQPDLYRDSVNENRQK